MAPFYGWGSAVFIATEPLRGDSLLCTTKSQGVHGTHFIDLGMMKGRDELGATYTITGALCIQSFYEQLSKIC